MKEWKKPVIVSLTENELKSYILASACSGYTCSFAKTMSIRF